MWVDQVGDCLNVQGSKNHEFDLGCTELKYLWNNQDEIDIHPTSLLDITNEGSQTTYPGAFMEHTHTSIYKHIDGIFQPVS